MLVVWRYCAFISYLVQTVWSQGSVSLTLSKNPIYNGEEATLMCSFGKRMSLRILTIEAFNGTRRAGSVFCTVTDNATTNGIFEGMAVEGCLNVLPGYFRVTFRASPALELDYVCSIRASDDHSFYNQTSNRSHLTVNVLPEIPRLAPYNLVFNESDNASVVCESRNGKPAAHLNLTISTNKSVLNMATGNEYVSLQFSSPLDLRNATVSCSLMNHNFMNKSTKRNIIINYILARHKTPIEVYTNLRNVTKDCSTAIESVPTAACSWQIPTEANFAEQDFNTSIVTIPKGLSGFFNCTAINAITLKSVVITYQAINENATSAPLSIEMIFFSAVISVIILLAITTVIVRYKIYLKNGDARAVPAADNTTQNRRESGKCTLFKTRMKPHDRGASMAGDDITMTNNLLYESLPSETTDNQGGHEHLFTSTKANNTGNRDLTPSTCEIKLNLKSIDATDAEMSLVFQ